jgi:hypothetical protein
MVELKDYGLVRVHFMGCDTLCEVSERQVKLLLELAPMVFPKIVCSCTLSCIMNHFP